MTNSEIINEIKKGISKLLDIPFYSINIDYGFDYSSMYKISHYFIAYIKTDTDNVWLPKIDMDIRYILFPDIINNSHHYKIKNISKLMINTILYEWFRYNKTVISIKSDTYLSNLILEHKLETFLKD